MINDKNIIKSILEKSSEAKVPADLSRRVLSKWKSEVAAPRVAAPLIPKYIWWIVGGSFTAVFAYISSASSASSSSSEFSGLLEKFSPEVTFNMPQVSPVIVMAVVAFGSMIMLNAFILNYRSKARNSF